MMHGDEIARSGGIEQLAQLARLLEQDETLAAIVRGGRPEQHVDFSLQQNPPLPHLAREAEAPAPDWEGEALPAFVQRTAWAGPTAEPGDAGEYAEDEGPDYSNGLPDEWRGLKMFAALIGLALAGSASAYWVLSDARGRGDAARVMAASARPDESAQSPQEHTVLEERPRDRSDEASANATGRTTAGAEEPAEERPPIPQAPAPMDIVVGPGPTKIAGLTPEPMPPGSPAETAQSQPPESTKPALRRTAARAREPGGADGVHYVVQLSSERGEAAAHARSRLLQSKYPDAFAGRKPFVRRADLGDRGIYYRVQMGPFAIGEANQICGSLKKAGADCVVQRNEGHAPMRKDESN